MSTLAILPLLVMLTNVIISMAVKLIYVVMPKLATMQLLFTLIYVIIPSLVILLAAALPNLATTTIPLFAMLIYVKKVNGCNVAIYNKGNTNKNVNSSPVTHINLARIAIFCITSLNEKMLDTINVTNCKTFGIGPKYTSVKPKRL